MTDGYTEVQIREGFHPNPCKPGLQSFVSQTSVPLINHKTSPTGLPAATGT